MNDLIVINSDEIVEQKPINEELLKRFLRFIDVREKSIDTYKKALKQFFLYMANNEIKNPTREDILNYKDYLKKTHKPTTAQTYLTSVKLFFKWLDQEGIYKNVADNIKGVKIDTGHKKDYLTINQVKELLKSIDQSTTKGVRDYALISLLITTGLRTIEIVRANIEDIGVMGNDRVLYIQGKGHDDKTALVKIAEPVEKALNEYLKTRQKVESNAPLFASESPHNNGGRMTTRSISRIVKEAFKKAGYNSDRLTAHSTRHTAGTLNLLNGGTLEETQQLLRHTSINTTMIYLHNLERANNQSENRIASAIF